MTQVPYTLRVLAGETETRYGERLYHSGAVHIVEKSAKRLSCKVADGEMYDVVFTDDGESRCSCPIYEEAGACRHVVAAMIKCQDEGAMGDVVRRKAEAAGPKLMAAMDRALPEEGTIHMGGSPDPRTCARPDYAPHPHLPADWRRTPVCGQVDSADD